MELTLGACRGTVPGAIDAARAEARAAAIAAASEATERVIVLEGGDGTFCRGMDFSAEPDSDGEAVAAGAAWFARCLDAIHGAAKPTVAVVDGVALGGGLGLAAACDAVVASDRSTFGLPEALFGLAPAIIMPVLLERLPPQKARFLALTARTISAAEAERLGLVDRVVAPAQLDAAVRGVVRDLARPRPESAAAVKALVGGLPAAPVSEGISAGVRITSAALSRPQVRAAIAAFERGELPWEDE